MTFIKTSLLNGIAVVVRMLTLLCINKILAIYVGPTGYAALGQFQNAVQMITTFASGAINAGVTKYTAEYHEDEQKQHTVWRTAGSISVFGAIVTGAIVAVFNEQLSLLFLGDIKFGGVFIWFAATLVLFVLNTLLLAVLNGKKEIVRYVISNIAGSLFALAVTSYMAIKWGIYGALIALAVYQSISFFVTLVLCCRAPWFKVKHFIGRIDPKMANNLAKYTAMSLTSAACIPLSQILVRNHLGQSFGWEAAGYWEALTRLSGAYLMLITTTLSVYYLPRFSELKSPAEIRAEIKNGYKVILPLTILGALIIYVFRDLVVKLLFTPDFLPMTDLFAWQMVGDTLKIGSWVLAYLMLGKAMFKLFMASEIVFAVMFVVLSWFFTDMFGLQGVTIAYAVNYAIYWVVMGVCMSRKLDAIK
ncbi:O-antigen translocase [Pseudomonas extremorientalis]|jgi:PST family polysaccharide transporter|uniref:O-antigen translocase n=1 Tax=Pseudomonas extremorientalis TaxID=169669 RepID=UPI00211BEAE0|nr:O-antigen translocase [Pseudomonas extremorientalis]UUN90442.1 O-antigen translocase [Pseudomonas extremorientalis]